jgi:hypothetical protein
MSESEKLLTMEERNVCQKVAASEDALASQRATALLAIDGGATRAQAAEQTGLTTGQIGYLLRAFRQKHLDIFPDVEPDEAQPPAETVEPEAEASKPKADKGKKKAKKAKATKIKKGKTAKKKTKKK